MYQIDNSTAVTSRPASTSAGTVGWFTDGNPGAGDPATILPAEWLNTIMAELLSVLTAASVTPDKTASGQLLDSINILISARQTPSGMISYWSGSTVPTGWLELNGMTIGNGSSGASALASATAENLYLHLWASFDETILSIFTSGGSTTTRGASAAADFAAGKRLALFDARGEFFRGWDHGRGIDSGRAVGSWQSDEFKSHTHDLDIPTNSGAGEPSLENGGPSTTTFTSGPTGGTETRPRNIALMPVIKI